MAYDPNYQFKPGYGKLTKNLRSPSPASPDWLGVINIDGELKEVAGWLKKDWLMSISIREPSAKAYAPARKPEGPDSDAF